MIKIENNTNLVVNKDRHTVKTTTEYKVLPYERITQSLIDHGFTFADYSEQGYYNRSISKNRHGKGLFCENFVCPFDNDLGVSLSSSNDNQLSLYIHLTICGIPVEQFCVVTHRDSESLEQLFDVEGMINSLEELEEKIEELRETRINNRAGIAETYKAANDYRDTIITNGLSYTFIPNPLSCFDLFSCLCNDMIEGNAQGLNQNGTLRKSKRITQIRKRFLLGSFFWALFQE